MGRVRLGGAGDQAAPGGDPGRVRLPRVHGGGPAQHAEWLAVELCGVELSRDRLAEAVMARCRKDRLEPPTPGRIARLVGSAVSTFEERFCAATVVEAVRGDPVAAG